MKAVRNAVFVALLGFPLLAAWGGRATAADTVSAIPSQRIDGICARELSFDVTGPYYQSCRNYLRRHVRAQPVAEHLDATPEHRACEQIGLAAGTPDHARCVQELYQLDVSAAHL
jgi:hypothetical protein